MRSLLGVVLLHLASLGALGAQGIVAGVVRDDAGLPVAGARVSIQRDSVMAVLTRADGSFSIANVPAGPRLLEVAKVGYRPVEAMIQVLADSAILVNVTLVGMPQALPGVIVGADLVNRVRGVVLDRDDKPIEGVVVEMVGANRRMATGENGEFWFTDLPPGTYLLQWRKAGYTVSHRSVRMLAGIDRDFSVRLLPIGRGRFTAALAAEVAREADHRQGMAGSGAVIISREELETFGKARLLDILPTSSAAVAYRQTAIACVLVNGHDVATAGGAGAMERPTRGPRGIASIDPRGSAQRSGPWSLAPPPVKSWLSHYRASDVEMVEVYPQDSEHSRSLCGRFPPSSGCSCPPEPSGIVIWTR